MGASKLATLFIFFALIFCKIRADASIDEVDQPQGVVLSESSESEALKIELALLQEKIQTLGILILYFLFFFAERKFRFWIFAVRLVAEKMKFWEKLLYQVQFDNEKSKIFKN